MPHGERAWPDIEWTPGQLDGEWTGLCQYGVYERRLTGQRNEASGKITRLYEATFRCSCCDQQPLVGSQLSESASHRVCVDHYHRVCQRAAELTAT